MEHLLLKLIFERIEKMDATVAAIQTDVGALLLQAQTVVQLITDLRAQIASGAIDPTDKTALQQIDTQLQTVLASFSGTIAGTGATGATGTAAPAA